MDDARSCPKDPTCVSKMMNRDQKDSKNKERAGGGGGHITFNPECNEHVDGRHSSWICIIYTNDIVITLAVSLCPSLKEDSGFTI